MKRLTTLALLPLLAATAGAAELDGRSLYHEKCARCHDASGMGTGLLARRMDPGVAELEKRADLTVTFVERAARIGLLNMPPITRGDVADQELRAIALYLSRGNP
jgi:mono/diheme cytochrome c family protein